MARHVELRKHIGVPLTVGPLHKEFDPSDQIVNLRCYRKGLQHMGERVRRTRPVRWRNVDWFWQTTIVRWSSVLCHWCNFWPLEKWLWPYILVTSLIRPSAIYYFFRESNCTYESITSRIPLKFSNDCWPSFTRKLFRRKDTRYTTCFEVLKHPFRISKYVDRSLYWLTRSTINRTTESSYPTIRMYTHAPSRILTTVLVWATTV
jgi:hypothetical protein